MVQPKNRRFVTEESLQSGPAAELLKDAIEAEATPVAQQAAAAYLSSDPGVVAAAAEAAESAVDLALTASDRIATDASNPTISFAVTDDQGRASWIANDENGGVPPHSADAIVEATGALFAEDSLEVRYSGYSFMVTDGQNGLTDLRLREDGCLADDVVESLANRMNVVANTKPLGLSCLGDSITAGGQGPTDVRWSQLAGDHIGLPIWNPSQSGEATYDIAFRSGAYAPEVTVVGNGIGTTNDPVEISSITGMGTDGWRHDTGSSWNNLIGHFTNCRLMGVSGTLHHDQVDGTWTFTPTSTRGTAVPVPPDTPIYCTSGVAHRSDLWIMWPGRNDANLSRIMFSVNQMRDFLVDPTRFVVLSVLNSATETSGTGGYNNIQNINDGLSATYSNNYLDVRSHLVANGLTDNGLTPTSQDENDIANDVVPSSLRADATHPNMYGAISIAKAVNQYLDSKGWMTR